MRGCHEDVNTSARRDALDAMRALRFAIWLTPIWRVLRRRRLRRALRAARRQYELHQFWFAHDTAHVALRRTNALWMERMPARLERLGWMIQPAGDE